MAHKRVRPHVNPLAHTEEVSFDGFGNARPVIVDIGAYKGEFIAGLLEQFPEKNYIVCEIRKPVVAQLEERFAEDDNVVVLGGDAGRNLRSILEPCMVQSAIIETIYINFPDPWFKPRHHKRRVITTAFLERVQEWVSPETTWVFQTDQEQLFAQTKELLAAQGCRVEIFDQPPYGVTTDWEDAKVRQGKQIWRLRFWFL